MERNILENLVEKNFSSYQIADKLECSQTNIRYWLKKFELTTKKDITNSKVCPSCNTDKELKEFYSKRGKKGGSSYCKPCTKDEGRERARKFKIKCVNYKGGKCEKCTYNKYLGALEFHHLDPNEKDFGLATVTSHAFNDNIKKELDKCMLVCSNCQKEIHGSVA